MKRTSPLMRNPVHTCPDPCCGEQVPDRHFACPPDWFRLPVEHRDAILRGFINRRQDHGASHVEAMAAAALWYSDNAKHRPGCSHG